MALDPALVGRSYPPSAVYEVGRQKIAEFADAIGAVDPVHRDAEAARAAGYPDVIAPPTFAIALTLSAAGVVVEDPDVALDYSRVVHGEQKFAHHRPIRAGDRLVATTQGLRLAKAFLAIEDTGVRAKLVAVAEALSGREGSDE